MKISEILGCKQWFHEKSEISSVSILPISPALKVNSLSSTASKSYKALAFFSSFLGLLDEAAGALVAFPYKELEGYNDDDVDADEEELLVVWLDFK